MAKKREKMADPGSNWMDTWTDLVSLLMCFFVLLFAFSTVDASLMRAMSSYFNGAVIVDFSPLSPSQAIENPVPQIGHMGITGSEQAEGSENPDDPSWLPPDDTGLVSLYESIEGFIGSSGLAAVPHLEADEFAVRVIFEDLVFFRSGDATLLPGAHETLDLLIDFFVQHSGEYMKIKIEGHADNRPINTAQYPSNWELSSQRALSVHRYIRNTGRLEPRLITIGGYGEEYPIATNDTEEGRARNRRVEFVIEVERPEWRQRMPVGGNDE